MTETSLSQRRPAVWRGYRCIPPDRADDRGPVGRRDAGPGRQRPRAAPSPPRTSPRR